MRPDDLLLERAVIDSLCPSEILTCGCKLREEISDVAFVLQWLMYMKFQ
jgi:hypothetical protein